VEKTDDPEKAALDSVEDSRALAALGELPEDQRSLIIMKDIEDLAISEISEITGIASGTVKSRLHRARAKLARIMERGEG
jgi:RNA polymerase sigma-70 factor (ECF subfamily)